MMRLSKTDPKEIHSNHSGILVMEMLIAQVLNTIVIVHLEPIMFALLFKTRPDAQIPIAKMLCLMTAPTLSCLNGNMEIIQMIFYFTLIILLLIFPAAIITILEMVQHLLLVTHFHRLQPRMCIRQSED